MDEDLDDIDYEYNRLPQRESQGDLTLDMLGGAMPKKAIEAN